MTEDHSDSDRTRELITAQFAAKWGEEEARRRVDLLEEASPQLADYAQLNNAKPNSESWIAARFDGHLPPQMSLGDGMTAGDFVNRPLNRDRDYRVFVRAHFADDVSDAMSFFTFR